MKRMRGVPTTALLSTDRSSSGVSIKSWFLWRAWGGGQDYFAVSRNDVAVETRFHMLTTVPLGVLP